MYDYMGRRVEKKVWTHNGSSWGDPTEHRKFVWNGWLLLMELDGLNDDAMLRKRTWGLDLAGLTGGASSVGPASGRSMQDGAGGIGGLLAVYDTNGTTTGENPEADDMAYVYFYDANGNVGQVCHLSHTPSDPAGAIVARYEYDPYGNVTSQSGAYASANPFRFSTKYFDDETGLGYWGYRYYDPKLGRWVNRDPIGELGGVNLYAYVGNSPLLRTDPYGQLWTWACCTLCVGSIAADLGGGAIGCLWGCLDFAHGSYSTSECFYDCIMMYLQDRMDHTQAFNIYKSLVEGSSCICCGIKVVDKLSQALKNKKIVECQAMYAAYKAAWGVPGCKNNPPTSCAEALSRLAAAQTCYTLRSRFWNECTGLLPQWIQDPGHWEQIEFAGKKQAECAVSVMLLCGDPNVWPALPPCAR